jgi:hypothetical protein
VPGQRSGKVTYRAMAGAKPRQGNSRVCYVADRKIDARPQTQDSPRRTSGHAAQIRGSEHDHRRLKASSPPLHDHNLDSFQNRSWRKDTELRVRRLTKDIRANGIYSITSSARTRIAVGTSRPSALAVLRLRIVSNFVARSTGRSVGFAPFKILSTNVAARRNRSGNSMP